MYVIWLSYRCFHIISVHAKSRTSGVSLTLFSCYRLSDDSDDDAAFQPRRSQRRFSLSEPIDAVESIQQKQTPLCDPSKSPSNESIDGRERKRLRRTPKPPKPMPRGTHVQRRKLSSDDGGKRKSQQQTPIMIPPGSRLLNSDEDNDSGLLESTHSNVHRTGLSSDLSSDDNEQETWKEKEEFVNLDTSAISLASCWPGIIRTPRRRNDSMESVRSCLSNVTSVVIEPLDKKQLINHLSSAEHRENGISAMPRFALRRAKGSSDAARAFCFFILYKIGNYLIAVFKDYLCSNLSWVISPSIDYSTTQHEKAVVVWVTRCRPSGSLGSEDEEQLCGVC